ncbi:MAG: hypothetical protein GC154_20150 [bacterium]|nr:hypothetical protein [bacterium]
METQPVNQSEQPARTPSPTRRRIFALLAIALGLCASFLMMEFACRLLGVGEPNLTLTGNKRLFIPNDDPEIAFTMRPDYEDFVFGSNVRINAKGLRDEEVDYEKPDGVKRILLLGDSVTFGYGVKEGDCFGDQWEAWLNRRQPGRWQVINSGVPAWTTVQEVRWFETEGLRYQPDAVALTYVMNDPEPVHRLLPDGTTEILPVDEMYRGVAELFPKPVLPFTGGSYLMKFLNRTLLLMHPNWREVLSRLDTWFNRDIFEQPGWDACLAAFERLKRDCGERGIFLLVIQHPLMFQLYSKEGHAFTPHYQRVEQALTERGIAYVNPLDDYIGQRVSAMRAYVDDPHPSRAAHLIHAQRLHREFQQRWDGYQVEDAWE